MELSIISLQKKYSVRKESFKFKSIKVRSDNTYKFDDYPVIIIDKNNTSE